MTLVVINATNLQNRLWFAKIADLGLGCGVYGGLVIIVAL